MNYLSEDPGPTQPGALVERPGPFVERRRWLTTAAVGLEEGIGSAPIEDHNLDWRYTGRSTKVGLPLLDGSVSRRVSSCDAPEVQRPFQMNPSKCGIPHSALSHQRIRVESEPLGKMGLPLQASRQQSDFTNAKRFASWRMWRRPGSVTLGRKTRGRRCGRSC